MASSKLVITGENTAAQNFNSGKGFDVVDETKAEVERVPTGVVSGADILAIAARDSVGEVRGHSCPFMLGRRDSTNTSKSSVDNNIPPPTSSAHTVGQARCTPLNESDINKAHAKSLRAKCPTNGGDNRISPLDFVSPTALDNNYYKNPICKKRLLRCDQQVSNGGSTDSKVKSYSWKQKAFIKDFLGL